MTPATRRASRRSLRIVVRVLTVAAITLAVLLVLLGVAVWSMYQTGDSSVEAGRPVRVEIPQGASTTRIGELLVEAGVVDSASIFRLRARFSASDGALLAGVYDMRTGSEYADVIAQLQKGPVTVYHTVTIPEGYVVDQMAARFEEQAGVPAKDFLRLAKGGAAVFAEDHPYLSDAYQASLEGYLFPKTYSIKEGSSAQEVIEMMLDQFDAEMEDVDLAYPESHGLTLNDTVVLASMIEREAKIADERQLVSSVIYNRLRRNMKLEIDATLEYVLPGNRFRLRAKDLKVDSPYNTYMYGGLPPGPIASPGLASLRAAADPAPSEYLYYVLTGKDGSHTFCTTKEEFLVAKAKSKEVFGK